jgi:hypothetical protein
LLLLLDGGSLLGLVCVSKLGVLGDSLGLGMLVVLDVPYVQELMIVRGR